MIAARAPATYAGTPRETLNLDLMARRFADQDAGSAEPAIDDYIGQAVADWRIVDATFWQRVKFRSRLIRAMARGRGDWGPR